MIGQPIATNTILSALRYHFNNKNPKKALVLSFHGPTGVGKTYVTELIEESLYSEKSSEYRRLFNAHKDFKHQDKIDEYKVTVK